MEPDFINQEEKHYDLNDFFDCRISHGTLHIHVVPTSVKEEMSSMGRREFFSYVEEKLDDALSRIPAILNEESNSNIRNVFAVSPALKLSAIQEMFKNKGFDVSMTDNDYFLKMFDSERVGQAIMSREKFLEIYGNKTKTSNDIDVNEGDNKTFKQVADVYKKVQKILEDNGLKIYLAGGTVPYILQNEDSGRLHNDVDTVCNKDDMDKLREVFIKEGLYKEDWDSKNFSEDGEDYGFEMKIDGVPFGIYPFEYDELSKTITQYSVDPYTKTCKTKTIPIQEISDYITYYRGLDGNVYSTMSLEYIKLTKDNAKRRKDIIDSKKIEETGLLRKDVMNRVQMYKESINDKEAEPLNIGKGRSM